MNIISVFKRFRLFKKHFSTFAPYLTPRKVFNLALNEYEMRRGKINLKSLPPFIKVDPTPVCNLRCPGCSQSDPEFKRRFDETNHLTVEKIKTIIEPLKDTLLGVSLSLSGEPFTNPNLPDIISYLHNNKISVNFPSNFSSKFSEGQLEKIIKSGLDTIYVSLDGISEESYKQYRVGGSFELVRKNVERFAAMKAALRKKKPHLVWKFVVFDHNRDEVDFVKKYHKKWHFDSYRIDLNFHSEQVLKIRQTHADDVIKNRKKCFWLWNTFMVLWDGTVYPCCNWNFEEDIFNLGNVYDKNIREIWNSEPYTKLRYNFTREGYGKELPNFCKDCMGIPKN